MNIISSLEQRIQPIQAELDKIEQKPVNSQMAKKIKKISSELTSVRAELKNLPKESQIKVIRKEVDALIKKTDQLKTALHQKRLSEAKAELEQLEELPPEILDPEIAATIRNLAAQVLLLRRDLSHTKVHSEAAKKELKILKTETDAQIAKVEALKQRILTEFRPVEETKGVKQILKLIYQNVRSLAHRASQGSIFLVYARALKLGVLAKKKSRIEKEKKELSQQLEGLKLKAGAPEKIEALELKLRACEEQLESLTKSLQRSEIQRKRGDEVRAQLTSLGGERVQIHTPDGVKLDSMYLDARAFRQTLADAKGKLATYETADENGKARTLQAIELPDDRTAAKKILSTLENLHGLPSDPMKVKPKDRHLGSGWSPVETAGKILLVLSEELPDPNSEAATLHPFFNYDRKTESWSLKSSLVRNEQPLDTSSPAAGTVIVSSGNAGVYEMDKDLALSFLFRNMNVVLFNYRGYGESKGVPSEQGLKIDMESAYQLAKKRSGHSDSQILFKAFCFSGGPAAYVASKHPETNLFLDQTYSDFRTLAREDTENEVGQMFKGKIPNWLAKPIIKIAAFLAPLTVPNFKTAETLAKVRGKKAIFYTLDDDTVNLEHVIRNFNAAAKVGKMESVALYPGRGEHGVDLLVFQSSFTDYDKKMDEQLKDLRKLEETESAELADLTYEKAETSKIEKKKEALQAVRAVMAKRVQNQYGVDVNPEAVVRQRTAQSQMSHFLARAQLSDPLLKTEFERRPSFESPASRTISSVTAFINEIETMRAVGEKHKDLLKAEKVSHTLKIDNQMTFFFIAGDRTVPITTAELDRINAFAEQTEKMLDIARDLSVSQSIPLKEILNKNATDTLGLISDLAEKIRSYS